MRKEDSMKARIAALVTEATGEAADIAEEAREEFGHYTTPVALRLGKMRGVNPRELAEELAGKIRAAAPEGFFATVETAGPGFINMRLTAEAIQKEFGYIAADASFGQNDSMAGRRVMVEYTDPNPFKQFHIGHLMTNTIGESLARLHEAAGAEVLRVNYQGDVGLHVGMSLWGMLRKEGEMPAEEASLSEKAAFLGQAYAAGATAYKESPEAKAEIEMLNKRVYERSDERVNALYDRGRAWSLAYFETLYARLGTKFAHYFFESETGPDGLAVTQQHPEVFIESQGAVIFPGEKYGLHSRVFINSLGLPTYEAKELGLNKKKFDLYHPDLSIIVTGNEINEYFKVLLRAMELTVPEVAARTKHLGHGMLRLPTGKMSSRTGDVITAEGLLEEVRQAVGEKVRDNADFADEERENIKEQVALAAFRYSVLRQGIGKDIIFDLETSVAFHGESGPYLQYTYARLRRVILKAGSDDPISLLTTHYSLLTTSPELRLMRKLFAFPDEVRRSTDELSANNLANYLYELANLANRFYEDEPILTDEDAARRTARLALVATTARILRDGLRLLGINVLESM